MLGPAGVDGGRGGEELNKTRYGRTRVSAIPPPLGPMQELVGVEWGEQRRVPQSFPRGLHSLLLPSGDPLPDQPPNIPLPSPHITFHLWTDEEQLCESCL